MRLIAQSKCGFYPIPPAACEQVARLLSPAPAPGRTVILDPCCGRAAALRVFANRLGCAEGDVFGVELDERRGREAAALVPNVLQPADFLGTLVSSASFSFAWINPPYDDEIGGGKRVEYSFLTRATTMLVNGGVLALACPERVARRHEIQSHFIGHYHRVCMFPYPEGSREYDEMVILGVRRAKYVDPRTIFWEAHCTRGPLKGYQLPPAGGPKVFQKTSLTETEIAAALEDSELMAAFHAPRPLPLPSPGLQLSHGQRALVLAGGFLNRVLVKPGYDPIVIKASPYKETKLKEASTEEDEDGKVRHIEIHTEQIKLLVRAVSPDGTLHDLKQ